MEGTDQLEISIPKKPASRLNNNKNIRQCSTKLNNIEPCQVQETIPLTQQNHQSSTSSPYATLQHNSNEHFT